ncbi:MAG: hypothetical protein KAJ62_08275 [Desulfobacteraceae bacterium]|nr:hypothetical protein [Desulfobacteraceae bacterium]
MADIIPNGMIFKNYVITGSTLMISKDEIEILRRPSEYIQWFDSHLKTTGRDQAYREGVLQHEGIFKQFYEELFPLFSLLKHKKQEWKDSRFRNVLGSQSYDVEIENHALAYLEIGTTEFDGIELFRMREFTKNGNVSLLGRPMRDHKHRPIAIEDEGRSHNELVQETVDSISALIKSKSKKNYPNGTGLIVYYDDSSSMFNENDNQVLCDCVDSLKPNWTCTFDAIYLVGPRGNILIEDVK